MKTYLGEIADTQEALEFLCLLKVVKLLTMKYFTSITKDVTNKKFGARVRAILKEEQGHLQLCTKLAKTNAQAE